jgi:hypothetical protein
MKGGSVHAGPVTGQPPSNAWGYRQTPPRRENAGDDRPGFRGWLWVCAALIFQLVTMGAAAAAGSSDSMAPGGEWLLVLFAVPATALCGAFAVALCFHRTSTRFAAGLLAFLLLLAAAVGLAILIMLAASDEADDDRYYLGAEGTTLIETLWRD